MAETQDQTNESASGENPNLEQMRKKAERADTLEAENRRLRTRDAFREAGISTSEGTPGALLYQNFTPGEDGSITSEAVLEAAQRFGIQPAAAAQAPAGDAAQGQQDDTGAKQVVTPQQADEAAFFAQSAQAAGGNPGQAGDEDPNDAAFRAYTDTLKNGLRKEEAVEAGFGKIFEGAAKGDKRVVYDQAQWRERFK